MLEEINSHLFTSFIGKTCTMDADNGMALTLSVQSVTLLPRAQMPTKRNISRTPFIVELQAAANTPLVNVYGILRLPETTEHQELKIEGVNINRTLEMGRDPAYSYFQLIFN